VTCGRTFITIQERVSVDDGAGGRTTSWVDVCTAFGTPRWVKGSERTASSDGDQVATLETWLITIRFKSGITTAMRVVWNGDNYNIRSAADRDQKGRHLVLEIERGVAD